MAGNQEDRPPEMRKRILKEALRLFGENGYEGASIQAVADAVGIRKPSLLYHFGSKEALRNAVNEDLLNHWQRELPRLVAGKSDGHDRFSATIEALVGFFLEDTNRARVAIREILDRPDELRKMAADQLWPWTRLLIDYIRMGQEAGIIKPDVDPEAYIIQVMMMVIGTVALGPVLSVLTDADGNGHMEPKIRELVRIARDTLFVESPIPEKDQ